MQGLIELDRAVELPTTDGRRLTVPAGRWAIRFIPGPGQAPDAVGAFCRIGFSPPVEHRFRTADVEALCRDGAARLGDSAPSARRRRGPCGS